MGWILTQNMTICSILLTLQMSWNIFVFTSFDKTWNLGSNSDRAILHVKSKNLNAIFDNNAVLLCILNDNEIINGSIINREKNRLFLKIDYKKSFPNGITGQWYSKLIVVSAGKRANFATSLLSYDCNFLQNRKIVISELISPSDDGISIKIETSGQDGKSTRILEPFTPRFLDERF